MLKLQVSLVSMVVLFLGSVPGVESLAQSTSGVSYKYIIPFVTTENNTRTNLGLNSYSQASIVKGLNPSANVVVRLFDQQGKMAGSGNYVVQLNQLVQINSIISALGGAIGTGWLEIGSDEPIAAWASVIFNSTDDPSIELAIDEQVDKPIPYVEGIARGGEMTRLLIESSAKTAKFQSSLVVVNLAATGGPFTIKIYDNSGQLTTTKSASISAGGMYLDNDIRNSVPGTYGQIVIEPGEGTQLSIVANSIIKSANQTAAFFPAFTLPNATYASIAGIWEGSVTGALMNGQIKFELHQERQMFYGVLTLKSGNFPTAEKSILMYGLGYVNNPGVLQNANITDTDPEKTIYSLRIIGALHFNRATIEGSVLYWDSRGRSDTATLSLTRSGSIY